MSANDTSRRKGTSVRRIVTDHVLSELRQGIIPWEKPWVTSLSAPVNYVSRAPYRGVNRLLLPMPGEYLTANQAEKLGGVRKEDAEGYIITFYAEKPARRNNRAGDDEDEDAPVNHVLRYYRVYHVSDVEGVQSRLNTEADRPDVADPLACARGIIDSFASRSGITVIPAPGAAANFDSVSRTVVMPPVEEFWNPETWFAAAFRELVKAASTAPSTDGFPGSTQDSSRISCQDSLQDIPYVFSRETLAQEIGTAMLLTRCGMDARRILRDNSGHIDGWIAALDADPSLIIQASRDAEHAYEAITGN